MFKVMLIVLLLLITFNTLAIMLFLFSLTEYLKGKKNE